MARDAVLDINLQEDRYSRLKLIPWWEQERLRKAKIMVVGAGALGNEILKNLALLGVGSVIIVDLDLIENSNLSRSVLFRQEDEGKPKAQIAALRVREINPDVQTTWLQADINYDVGLGMFRDVDLVIGGLDNREARLAINQKCWKVNRPWIDGAIEVLQGVARVFIPPEGPCYECTMGEMDYKLLNMRRSCALLNREQMLTGKVPTTPTVSSVIAAVQVQEAVKLLHENRELPVLAGKGFIYNGSIMDTYVVEYTPRKDCPSHDTYEEIRDTYWNSNTSFQEIYKTAVGELGPGTVLELEQEVVWKLVCPQCKRERELFRSLGKISEKEATCAHCGELCNPELTHTIDEASPLLQLTPKQLGLPEYDIITGRNGWNRVHYLLAGDRRDF